MKIYFNINPKIVLGAFVVIIVLGGALLSRPIVLQSCGDVKNVPHYTDIPHVPECDQYGRWLCMGGGGTAGNGVCSDLYFTEKDKGYFSLWVMKNRLVFVFKKYVLGAREKEAMCGGDSGGCFSE